MTGVGKCGIFLYMREWQLALHFQKILVIEVMKIHCYNLHVPLPGEICYKFNIRTHYAC